MGNILQPYNPIKSGLAQINGGATQYGIPTSTVLTSVSTTGINANEVRYVLMRIEYPITLTAWEFEVTTGPASNANVAIGIYGADSNLQPTALYYDSGSIAVASSFTGIKGGSLGVRLPTGMYLVALNADTAMTIRALFSGSQIIGVGLGTSPMVTRVFASQTFGAFPNPGTKWTGAIAGNVGMQNFVAWQWTEPG